ncbi:MAG: hypothetical protein K2P81_15535 [Bacteriovoracaceae bacterium]|nr:hypothetical protein [Bacteriovoracaceae bacterium]
MKNIFAFVLLALALPAMAQVIRYPYPYPYPGPNPWPTPIPPQQQCFGERYDRVSALTQAAAQDKLDSFSAEKGVNCTLTSASLDYASGRCEQVTGELFAVLKMSFNIDCMSRTVSSNLRKTVIKYYR